MFFRSLILTLTLLFFSFLSLSAEVTLPKIFGDHMVLQRQKEVKIWGWAKSGESVKVSFNGQTAETKASKKGTWLVTLKPMEHGGPFEMQISGKSNTIVLKDILIGDVWLGSGQSNMEWPLETTADSQTEIASANFPRLRLFTVGRDMSFVLKDDVKQGEWLECNSQNVRSFSAVAYYFGKKLQEELDVPIGLINSSWGGTRVEPWISWDWAQKEPEYRDLKLEQLEKTASQNAKNQQKYIDALRNDKGISERWFDSDAKITGWKTMDVPQDWTRTEIGNADGIVWFRREINLPGAPSGEATLSLGQIDDADETYINGVKVGSTNDYSRERVYKIQPGILKEGKNLIAIKVTDFQGGGGLVGKPEQMFIDANDIKIRLDGQWEWKTSVLNTDFGIREVGPNAYPSHLYNAMIAPIINFPIRGVIWYQGESNAGESYRYRELFPLLVRNWREKWGYEFPFLWAQLANFMRAAEEPGESGWAELREAQRLTLALPKTGQAVLLDIGDANDIHPRNKRDVGIRLAYNALAIEYGKDLVYSGPVYKSMEVKDGKAILSFDHVGSGLVSKGNRYGYLNGFAIAGEDQKFRWARAFVQGDKVVVFHEDVKNPVAVRYAWADNPDDANLFNKEGLPASSFKTDQWKWSTDK